MSKINALEARLDALSEQALHAAARESAREVFERMLSEKKQNESFPNQEDKDSERKQLPE